MATNINPKNAAVYLSSSKVGNVRHITKGDKTYTRIASANVSNPRSEGQMRTRTRVANITSTYREMKEMLKGGFESASPSVSEYNLYFKNAMGCMPIYLDKNLAKQGAAVAAPYGVSEGSLRTIGYALNGGGILVSDIALGTLSIGADTTVGQLAKAIIDNNKAFEYGDFISYVALLQDGNASFPTVNVIAEHLMLEKNSSEKVSDLVGLDGFASNGGYLAMNAVPAAGCYAWVHGRKGNGGRKVSTQFLYNCNQTMTDLFSSDVAFEEASDSYGQRSGDPFYTSGENAGGDTPGPTPSTQKTLTVNIASYCANQGKVSINGGTLDNTEKTLQVEPGTQVTIKAEPLSGYNFCNWQDGDHNAQRTITVNDDVTYTAEFEES